jgi:hypothetical protein
MAQDKEELERIISQLEISNSNEGAIFEINRYGGGPEESYAKANRSGLELFAVQLLTASKNSDQVLKEAKKPIITVDYPEDWIQGETVVQYIEIIPEDYQEVNEEISSSSLVDKIIPAGCIAILVFAIISGVVGAVTIFKWLF